MQDFLRLRFAQVVAVRLEAVARIEIGRLEVFDLAFHPRQHRPRLAWIPRLRQQPLLGDGRCRRGLDEFDHAIDVGQRHRKAFEHVPALARLAQIEHGTAGDDLAPVRQERRDHLLQIEQARLAVDQGDHIDPEGVLQLRLFVEVVEHDLGHLAALEFDDHAHSGLVGLVLDMADALDLFLLHQFGDALEQGALVDLIGKLVDDDGLTLALFQVFDVAARAHHHPAAPGAIRVAHTGGAVDDARSREVWRGYALHQFFNGRIRVAQQMQAGVEHFTQVVRRNVGRHAHGDARRTVDEEVGQTRWQQQRFLLRSIVVRTEIDCLLVDIGEHFMRDLRQADFGVAHCRGIVAIDRSEVALTIDQHVAKGKILRHAHNGVIHGLVAVRVIFTDHVADDARRFLVGPVPRIAQFVHGVEHTAVHWLEAVPHVWQCPSDNDAHGVIEVRAAHFRFEADR
ncbi:hypothetical protein GALL_450880 [mine drainage metagenome]|uniref:NAD-specific glutamate dehydrogenase n=1 Tax=mine drainage metagenome TaxID=410659 RepID=A0A1J5Q0A1_9ZZZZ